MKKRSNLVAFMQAYMLSLGGINEVVGIILGRSDRIMIMNLIPLAALIALHFVISNKSEELNLNKKALFFVYYIVSVIIIYKYAYRRTTLNYEEVLTYIIIPIYLSFYRVDVEKLSRYMLYISLVILPFSAEVFSIRSLHYDTIGMSTTYNMLPFVVAAILHFWYFRKNSSLLVWLGYIANIYYLVQILMYGNRGPIVALMALCVLIWLHKFDKNGKMKENKTRTVIISTIVGIGVIMLVYNFEAVLIAVNNWFNSMGISVAALTKSIQKMNAGDLSNGRETIFKFTLEGIKENYLLGNGIASMFYRSYRTFSYPHNMFLQMWYDLGVIVSIPLVWITAKTIMACLFKSDISKKYAVALMFLFTLSIPRLCYSAEFWTNIPFWLLLMYFISPNLYKEEEESDQVTIVNGENEKVVQDEY